MATLWTPGGEHEVPKEPEPAASNGSATADAPAATDAPAAGSVDAQLRLQAEELGIDLDALDPEQRAQAEAAVAEMIETQARLAQVPAADVISNHLMGIYELATIHLRKDPPDFAEAALAIDAFRAVLDRVGTRLGESGPVLNQALSQIQMAFVQMKDGRGGSDEGETPPDADTGETATEG